MLQHVLSITSPALTNIRSMNSGSKCCPGGYRYKRHGKGNGVVDGLTSILRGVVKKQFCFNHLLPLTIVCMITTDSFCNYTSVN